MNEHVYLQSYDEIVEILSSLRLLIREKRRRLRLTQDAAAEAIGMDGSTLCRFERGETAPGLPTSIRMIAWLGVSDADHEAGAL
jgi:DNA-binding XRE family transcriptional regulator